MNAITKFLQQFLGGMLWGFVVKILLGILVLMFINKLMRKLFASVDAKDIGNFAQGLLSTPIS